MIQLEEELKTGVWISNKNCASWNRLL